MKTTYSGMRKMLGVRKQRLSIKTLPALKYSSEDLGRR
jgi:hypothetical protein